MSTCVVVCSIVLLPCLCQYLSSFTFHNYIGGGAGLGHAAGATCLQATARWDHQYDGRVHLITQSILLNVPSELFLHNFIINVFLCCLLCSTVLFPFPVSTCSLSPSLSFYKEVVQGWGVCIWYHTTHTAECSSCNMLAGHSSLGSPARWSVYLESHNPYC